MRFFIFILCWGFLYAPAAAVAQSNKSLNRGSIINFVDFYPINTDPYIGWKSNMTDKETILFETNPEVRISLYNNFVAGMNEGRFHTSAYYIHFRPQLRMFSENSSPVKTISTPILLGTQHAFLFNRYQSDGTLDDFKRSILSFSFETGHYSNGQKMGAFTEAYEDGSPESEAIYNTITPTTNLSDILNRNSGNFSTNLTEIRVNYRANKLDSNAIPVRTHSITFGGTLYHNRLLYLFNLGGYSANDIKIYGRIRLNAGYEYVNYLPFFRKVRYALAENIERIFNAHPFVEPMRFETSVTVYPFPEIGDLGFFLSHTWGHDNYNYRFVDSGHQFGIGASFSVFPPFTLKQRKN